MKNINNWKEFESLAGILCFELYCRKKNNSRYSLRAFAKYLSLTPSQLSLILKKRKGLSLNRAESVGKSLGYSDDKLKWFLLTVKKDFDRGYAERIQARKALSSYKNGVKTKALYASAFKINWYHLAIRRMTLLQDFKLNAEWISKRIALPVQTVQGALDDLLKHKLIKVNNNKVSVTGNLLLLFQNEDPATTRKRFLTDITQEIEKKIKTDPNAKIHDGNHFFTINTEQLKTLKKLIQNLEDQADDLTYKKTDRNHLCYLRVQLVKMNQDVK